MQVHEIWVANIDTAGCCFVKQNTSIAQFLLFSAFFLNNRNKNFDLKITEDKNNKKKKKNDVTPDLRPHWSNNR